jgi:REP element-mobilizing transposase RayT
MSNSYVSNHVHMVFSTKERFRSISPDLQPELWAFLGGVAENHGFHARIIGGVADHVHALVDLGAVLGIAKAAQVLKANSSRWMNERSRLRFEWQEGYFACSVSHSQIAAVRTYIQNQAEHHRRISSRDELCLLLSRHGLKPGPELNQSPKGTA